MQVVILTSQHGTKVSLILTNSINASQAVENAQGRRERRCKWWRCICIWGKREDCSTWIPWLARNCLKSAILMSPTKTVLCGGGGVERGSKDNVPFSAFPTSASTHATSKSPSYNKKLTYQKHVGRILPIVWRTHKRNTRALAQTWVGKQNMGLTNYIRW